MKSPLISLLLIFSNCLAAQDYVNFEKPVQVKVIGDRVLVDEDGQECILPANTEIIVLARGYNKEGGNYLFKSKECSGSISFTWITGGPVFTEQDKKAGGEIYRLKNEQALKEAELDRLAKKKAEERKIIEEKARRLECAYTTNEVDIFDKVRTIRTSAQWIADGLYVILYSNGGKKEVVFSSIDLGCTSPKESTVRVMLDNEDVLTFYHSRRLDCGSFELWGNISNAEIARLKRSPIKAIRMQGTEYQHTITEFDWPTFFIDQLKCYDPS